MQVVADLEHIAGEIGDGVFGGVLALALGAPAHILRLGQGAQQLVLQLRRFLAGGRQLLVRAGGNVRAVIDQAAVVGRLWKLVQVLVVAHVAIQH